MFSNIQGDYSLNRFGFLALVGLLLALHALVVAHHLESAFVIVAYCWGWVAVSALFGRLEAVKSMAATMVVLLLLSALFVMVTPFGRGNTSGFYALAWFPSLVSFTCVYIYAVYLQRSDATPNVSLDAEITGLSMPSQPRDIKALRMKAEQFTRQISENAVGHLQSNDDEIFDEPGNGAVDVTSPTLDVQRVA